MTGNLAILNDLQYGEIGLEGQFLRGSNGTFLVQVKYEGRSMRAVYKPKAGEQPLFDFPAGTLCKREVATYLFDRSLGWELVPPTVYRRKAPLGIGSLQAYIPHNPQEHYFQLPEENADIRSKVLLFDFMLNNADRKAGHFIVDPDSHVWLIDHGLTFHEQEKLRTVAWDHTGESIPAGLQADILRVREALLAGSGIYTELKSYLSVRELKALQQRMKLLLDTGVYPLPPNDRRAIPWPPI
jgi:Phosphatidylinositol 3- and 4-kinase